MATETTQEWENAVVGTILGSSLGALALGGFQLANGEVSGLVSVCLGVCGFAFIGFHPTWNAQRQAGKERVRRFFTSSSSDPINVLRNQYVSGEIDDAEFDRRLRKLRAAGWYDGTVTNGADGEEDEQSEPEPIPTRN